MTPPASPRFGAGFRSRHYDEIVASPRTLDWFEVIADNFVGIGGPRRAMLARLRADHPVVLHGVGLSIAGVGALPDDYLAGLRALAGWLEPEWVSDHLCWTALGGHESRDLLPVAYTREVLDHVAVRVARVQDVLARRLLLENPTAYVAFRDDEMDEAEFFAALCRRTGCGMLLDVNNLYVNTANLDVDPTAYLAALPDGVVGYMHLAGHAALAGVRIDTHDADVPPGVWDLFAAAVRRFPDAGVIVERDDNLPPFAALAAEVEWARSRHAAAVAAAPRCMVAPIEPAPRRAALADRGPEPQRWGALQRGFFARLVDKPIGFDHGDAGLTALLDDGRPVGAARGMRVYSDAYAVSLRRGLAVNFPALARVIGAEDFDRLAAAYLREHPPRGHDLRSLGASLAAFVRSHAFTTDYGVDPGVLGELVAVEQAELEVLDEIDEGETIAPARLAAITPAEWEGARFAFARALRIVHTNHDVLPVVDAVGRGEHPERPLTMRGAYLVYRSGGRLGTERLSSAEATVLEALLAGGPFGAACAAAGGGRIDEAESAAAGARILVIAATRGLVVRVLPR